MNPKMTKYLSYLVLSTILFYGIFKYKVLGVYTLIIKFIFDLLGVEEFTLINYFNEISAGVELKENILGWLLYYPSYFFLHIFFISILYRDNKKVRNVLTISLFLLVSILVIGIVLSKYLEMEIAYGAFVSSFRGLFSLPFILLAIEGGRILYKDVQELSEKE